MVFQLFQLFNWIIVIIICICQNTPTQFNLHICQVKVMILILFIFTEESQWSRKWSHSSRSSHWDWAHLAKNSFFNYIHLHPILKCKWIFLSEFTLKGLSYETSLTKQNKTKNKTEETLGIAELSVCIRCLNKNVWLWLSFPGDRLSCPQPAYLTTA